jgi:hypothetical protein
MNKTFLRENLLNKQLETNAVSTIAELTKVTKALNGRDKMGLSLMNK